MTVPFGKFEGLQLIAMGVIPLCCALKFFHQARKGARLQVFALLELKRRYTTKPTTKDRVPYYLFGSLSVIIGTISIIVGIALLFFRTALMQFMLR